ncbi:MAG TPA: Ni/Fe hydrogenase subunit alpha [Phycisphaerae bacterium]|nr:Ni/Fe hydrogenase subunit alpha [Phycisphaerae bacterium]HQE26126.1 Ni/Fe hydrogenase subunit alpha [Phycisphaerae bacterium]
MSRVIKIDPVTRVEGHGRVTVHLDESGKVTAARFHVVEFRGFEKFCERRHFSEMPTLTERICGICPVSHHLAAAKAVDAICGVQPTPTARMLRELMHMGQMIQSHALSFFHLSSPDLLLGFDCPPEKRNIFGVISANPEIARQGIRLRQFGQEVIAAVGGRKIHPDVCVPGGMNRSLKVEDRDRLLQGVPEAKEITRAGIKLLLGYYEANREFVDTFASFPTNYMGLVTPEGKLEHYDGLLRMMSPSGELLEDLYDPNSYLSLIAEATEDFSYLKFPFYRPLGYPEGSYRVGPLARLNVCDSTGTPEANRELETFRQLNGGGKVEGSMYYHYARLVEILFGIERVEQLLNHADICGDDLIAESYQILPEGIGVIEAPRGTLFHHYMVDESGGIERVNLIVASGQNNYAMNKAVMDVALRHVDGANLTEPMLNKVEAAIRCYDPCLSCSTHAIGQMPLRIELLDASGNVIDVLARG